MCLTVGCSIECIAINFPNRTKYVVFTYFLGIDVEKFDRDGSEATDKAGSCLEERCEDEAEDDAAGLRRIQIEMLERGRERRPLETAESVDDPAEARDSEKVDDREVEASAACSSLLRRCQEP